MPIQVKTPDGNIAQFPDGMSDDAITAILAKEYPPAAPQAAPRWDVLGDIGRAAGGSYEAAGRDLGAALPDPLKMDLGPIASLKRMGSAI
jgi:hypothetical protein